MCRTERFASWVGSQYGNDIAETWQHRIRAMSPQSVDQDVMIQTLEGILEDFATADRHGAVNIEDVEFYSDYVEDQH